MQHLSALGLSMNFVGITLYTHTQAKSVRYNILQ